MFWLADSYLEKEEQEKCRVRYEVDKMVLGREMKKEITTLLRDRKEKLEEVVSVVHQPDHFDEKICDFGRLLVARRLQGVPSIRERLPMERT
jgi:hypothetical protein